jgi:RNA polymerase sigma-70 factor, ECF subfamily
MQQELVPNPVAADDAHLLSLIAHQRDAAAFDDLFKRHEKAAFSLAYHLTGKREAAEETVQEAMLKVWTAAGSYRGEGNVRSWLLKIVAREGIKTIKQVRRKQKEMTREAVRETRHSEPADAAYAEMASAVRQKLNSLPELERQLLSLHFGGGLTQQEIGEAMAMPQQTVSYKITETLKRLRGALSSAGFAAALPLIETRGLADVLCSGMTAPPGLHAKVMASAQLSGKAASAVARSTRRMARATSKSGSGLKNYVVAGSAAAAAGGVLYVLLNYKQMSSAAPVATPTAEVQPKNETAQPVTAIAPLKAVSDGGGIPTAKKATEDHYRNFVFNKPEVLADNFVLSERFPDQPKGEWDAKKKAFAARGESILCPNLVIPVDAVQITSKSEYMVKSEQMRYGTLLMKDKLVPVAGQGKLHAKLATASLTHVTYIFDNLIVDTLNGDVMLVTELSEPHEGSQLLISFKNMWVFEIEFKLIKREQIPAKIRDVEGIKKATGFQYLPRK